MSSDWKEKWGQIAAQLRILDDLRKKAEEDEKLDLAKAEDIIEEGLEGPIRDSFLIIESFLRKVIDRSKS